MPTKRNLEKCAKFFLEIIVRVILFVVFVELEHCNPFERIITKDEWWLYKYPRTDDIVPISLLWPLVIFIPFIIFIINFLITRDKYDLAQCSLGLTLSLALNGIITNSIKLSVGRPRPDFFWRCFPDGITNANMTCTGDFIAIRDGRKSFPSGHSSFSFAGMGFVAWYLMAKLSLFNDKGRGQAWRICLSIIPLCLAALIAISRTCDYHHHWQDVTIGSAIGLSISYLSYRQYFPKLSNKRAKNLPLRNSSEFSSVQTETSICESDSKPLLNDDEKDTKWI